MPTSARGRDPAVEEEFLGALYKGGELLASGQVVEAREHLEKAHSLQPKNEKAQNLLGLAYFKLGLYEQASAVYEKLVDDNPADATLRVNLGLVYLKTNNLERCIKEFETATDLEPTHKKAHNYLGLALAQKGDYGRAKEHFEQAGSDQMAEKMGKALAAQASGTVQPRTVVISPPESAPRPAPASPAPAPAPTAAAKADEEPIEVMSDEEVPSEAYVVPDDAILPASRPSSPALQGDWGAALVSGSKAPAPANGDEMRFAEDEGPSEAEMVAGTPTVEEMPVLDAQAVEVVQADAEPLPSAEAGTPAPAWLTMEAAEAAREEPAPTAPEPVPQPEAASQWVTETVADVPLTQEAPPVDASSDWGAQAVGDAAAQTWAEQPVEAPPEQQWTEQPVDASAEPTQQQWTEQPVDASAEPTQQQQWTEQPVDASADPTQQQWTEQPVDASAEPPQPEADAPPQYVQPLPDPTAEPSAQSWVEPIAQQAAQGELPAQPDDDSWATGGAAPEQPPVATAEVVTPEQAASSHGELAPDADRPPEPVVRESAVPDVPPSVHDDAWAVGPPEAALTPPPRSTRRDVPAPAPSAPLPITVEEPGAPAGYSPMSPQRLVDLGASGAWVREPTAGPFHVSADGLAVTVAGEMLLRMAGLVAVVGSVEVKPEHKRRRGRPTQEPFGEGASQLQRLTGNGVVYLEPGKTRFHAVDLTDQGGTSVDDDGAYLREELVFAFEEPISFENGRLSSEGLSMDLAHLKGTGRVLLQLDGSLRAMPIPLGAPMMVPLHRLVGWFGRVTPRLAGFGGRGAVELTGEGYALLGTPPEKA